MTAFPSAMFFCTSVEVSLVNFCLPPNSFDQSDIGLPFANIVARDGKFYLAHSLTDCSMFGGFNALYFFREGTQFL